MNKRSSLLHAFAFLSIFSLATPAHAGAVPGAQYSRQIAAPHDSVTYRLKFEAGVPARVSLRGDGSTDLDLYVVDSNGNAVTSDEGSTDVAHVVWTPRWTGYFTVRVVNLGAEENLFSLVTN